ncbi:hypothetical protein [Sphaerisporangium aureirubrum]|uniref:MFS transporter n=1 Tax=Sphaerisporangium aureirubrum TaxID=1544736 RepID=A0ABW1NA69_9ACTN
MHVLAGGAFVRPEVVVAAALFTGAVGFALTGRQRGFGTLLVACFAAQYGMHHILGAGATSPLADAHHADGGLTPPLAMLVAHGLVAALSGWWLERGEVVLATLLRLLGHTLLDLRHLLGFVLLREPEAGRRGPRAATSRVTAGKKRILASVLSGRGPPTLSPLS